VWECVSNQLVVPRQLCWHVSAICRVPSATITYERCVTFVSCNIVATCLDYCNSILYSTYNRNMAKLQRVTSSLARTVLKAPRDAHCHSSVAVSTSAVCCSAISFQNERHYIQCKRSSTPAYLNNLLNDRCMTLSMSLNSSRKPLLAIH